MYLLGSIILLLHATDQLLEFGLVLLPTLVISILHLNGLHRIGQAQGLQILGVHAKRHQLVFVEGLLGSIQPTGSLHEVITTA